MSAVHDEIDQIHESEKKARERIEDAEKRARIIREEADKETKALMAKAEHDAKQTASKMLSEIEGKKRVGEGLDFLSQAKLFWDEINVEMCDGNRNRLAKPLDSSNSRLCRLLLLCL